MFFYNEAIEELMLFQGIAAGESISRTMGQERPGGWIVHL
jgi:hypothetical protein